MKQLSVFPGILFFLLLPALQTDGDWKIAKNRRYDIYYQKTEKQDLKTCRRLFESAADSVEAFFGQKFVKKFDVRIHPNRASLDAQWQAYLKMPDFKSECWMVASGDANHFDLLAPRNWKTESCEHDWSDQKAVRRLFAHEMMHVFHGQYNASPDFSDVQQLDWFVEGLATYASGQCDRARLAEVQQAVTAGKIPPTLDQFWTGKLRYGLSGSVVMYLDHKYGRQKLLELLPLNNKKNLLERLGISEKELMDGWRAFIVKY